MTTIHTRLVPLVAVGLLVLSGCSSSAPTEEQMEAAWDACLDGFAARPEVVQQAWTDEYEAMWETGEMWWQFGGGDICRRLQRDIEPETWVGHTGEPSWYVDQYLNQS